MLDAIVFPPVQVETSILLTVLMEMGIAITQIITSTATKFSRVEVNNFRAISTCLSKMLIQ